VLEADMERAGPLAGSSVAHHSRVGYRTASVVA